ncbi:hypothetical protein TorRG33x02_218740 [Trema orientale]|uniref:Uncharacterized protein n=1 Tax=Trema orientale TaxID=63057 RepID=A0A2P5EA12_TREOI|nr:hypothetical protein TorRG33x02_218740 [Trema orientale]
MHLSRSISAVRVKRSRRASFLRQNSTKRSFPLVYTSILTTFSKACSKASSLNLSPPAFLRISSQNEAKSSALEVLPAIVLLQNSSKAFFRDFCN